MLHLGVQEGGSRVQWGPSVVWPPALYSLIPPYGGLTSSGGNSWTEIGFPLPFFSSPPGSGPHEGQLRFTCPRMGSTGVP